MNWLELEAGYKHGLAGADMGSRKLVAVVVMWLLGAAAFAGFAWLVQWQDGTAVEVPARAEVPEAVSDASPLATLADGIARTDESARHHLEAAERTPAAHAMDAALRGAEVGHESDRATGR